MTIEETKKFIAIYRPLYFSKCDKEYLEFASSSLNVEIKHPVRREFEEYVIDKLKEKRQDVKTIKWKLGLNLDSDVDPVKTQHATYSLDSLNEFCEKTNNANYNFSYEGIRDTFDSICQLVDDLGLKGYGSVYIISSMFFLSGGKIPIYDYYAHAAIKSLIFEKSPMEVYVPESVEKNAFSRGNTKFKMAINLLFEYMQQLGTIFEKRDSDMLIPRELDQALWVYGHAENAWNQEFYDMARQQFPEIVK